MPRLDLQFIAPPQTTVQLLFDPLTGEILNARGSGRIRITLEDEEFQMFGNFNVTSGDYTFVAGDIFLRRFQLRDGGIIRWEGDPANAQLNMTAAYRARPDIGCTHRWNHRSAVAYSHRPDSGDYRYHSEH